MSMSLSMRAPQRSAAYWNAIRRCSPTVVPVLPPTGEAAVLSLNPSPALSLLTMVNVTASSRRRRERDERERQRRSEQMSTPTVHGVTSATIRSGRLRVRAADV